MGLQNSGELGKSVAVSTRHIDNLRGEIESCELQT